MQRRTRIALLALALSAFATPAFADRLEAPAGAPWWMHVGAAALLWLHIGGGTLGLASGAVALLAPKGGTVHRGAGKIFLVSMLVMTAIGAGVSPFLGERMNVVAGLMSFYMVLTGWAAAHRREGVGALEIVGLLFALGGVLGTGTLAYMAAQTPEGTLDGTPPQAFYIFMLVSTIALASDIKVVARRGITGAQRIARHVWRMCFGLFVATGSLFLGQMQIFPEWIQTSALPWIAGLAPLPFLLFWMLRVRLTQKFA